MLCILSKTVINIKFLMRREGILHFGDNAFLSNVKEVLSILYR